MNYGIWIIVLAGINIITAFSGFPTGTKKFIIVVTTVLLLGIGFILRAIEKRRLERIREKKERIEELMREDINEIAHDVHDRVEGEIEVITAAETHEPHHHA